MTGGCSAGRCRIGNTWDVASEGGAVSLEGGAEAHRIEELEGEVERLKEDLAKCKECQPERGSRGRDLGCSRSFLDGTHHGRTV